MKVSIYIKRPIIRAPIGRRLESSYLREMERAKLLFLLIYNIKNCIFHVKCAGSQLLVMSERGRAGRGAAECKVIHMSMEETPCSPDNVRGPSGSPGGIT